MNHGNISPEIAKGLKVLQSRIAKAAIPSSKLDETLNIATWNIREFGKKARSAAAVHYIAEILGQFELISIAELRDNLTDLGRVLEVLGPTWRVIYSDALRDSGGNNERVGFVYDKRAVAFSGFAATANPPREKVGNLYLTKFDWWREPFMASFSAGSFDFVFLAAHAQWGTPAGRLVELQSLAEWIDLKRYDQILHYPGYPENFSNQAGVVDFYAGNSKELFPDLEKTAFTFQMSDHLPLWMQVNTNIEGQKLDEIIRAGK